VRIRGGKIIINGKECLGEDELTCILPNRNSQTEEINKW
jgi:hypothetical protein